MDPFGIFKSNGNISLLNLTFVCVQIPIRILNVVSHYTDALVHKFVCKCFKQICSIVDREGWWGMERRL